MNAIKLKAKRIVCFVAAISMMLGIFPMTVFAAHEEAPIRVTVEIEDAKESYNAGDKFKAYVIFHDSKTTEEDYQIGTIGGKFCFDNNKLQVTGTKVMDVVVGYDDEEEEDVRATQILECAVGNSGDSANKVTFSMGTYQPYFFPDGAQMFRVSFKALEDGVVPNFEFVELNMIKSLPYGTSDAELKEYLRENSLDFKFDGPVAYLEGEAEDVTTHTVTYYVSGDFYASGDVVSGDKISLTAKFPEENPWLTAKEKYGIGKTVKGKVARMADYGAFIELEEDIDGLLHVSQISREKIKKPEDVLTIGQEVEVKVIDFDDTNKKISLSMKALLPEPEKEEQDTREIVDVDIAAYGEKIAEQEKEEAANADSEAPVEKTEENNA